MNFFIGADPLDLRTAKLSWQRLSVVAAIACCMALVLTFGTADIGGEDTVNWFFSRTFRQDGLFNVTSRAPVLQLYLGPLTAIPYPWGPIIEKFLRGFVCFIAVHWALRRFCEFRLAVVVTLLWLPAIVHTAPAAQAYAFAAGFAALALRLAPPEEARARIGWSYALLLLAWLLRSNYLFLMIVVGLYDSYRAMMNWRVTKTLPKPAPLAILPVIMLVVFAVWSASHQSSHKWNNVFSITSAWLPYSVKTTGIGHISQAMSYAELEKGRIPNDVPFDSYFIHPKRFGNADTVIQMAISDWPDFAEFIVRNVRGFFTTAVSLTTIGDVVYRFTTFGTRVTYADDLKRADAIDHRHVTVGMTIGLLLLFTTAFRILFSNRDTHSVIAFAVGFGAVAAVAVLVSGSKDRFLHSYLGLTLLAGAAVGQNALAFRRRQSNSGIFSEARPNSAFLLAGVMVLVAIAPPGWASVGQNVTASFQRFHGDRPALSLLYSGVNLELFRTLDAHHNDCRGLMALEAKEIATFTRIPMARVFDIYEVPPFGRLGSSIYNGLRPERINCLFISRHLAHLAGLPPERQAVTNQTIRFQNYIGPYIEQLRADGARSIKIAAGEFIILGPVDQLPRKREK